ATSSSHRRTQDMAWLLVDVGVVSPTNSPCQPLYQSPCTNSSKRGNVAARWHGRRTAGYETSRCYRSQSDAWRSGLLLCRGDRNVDLVLGVCFGQIDAELVLAEQLAARIAQSRDANDRRSAGHARRSRPGGVVPAILNACDTLCPGIALGRIGCEKHF